MDKFAGIVRRCIDDYAMIGRGEQIGVAVSGGKDSLALLAALAHLREYHPSGFSLTAVTVDMGFAGTDFSAVAKFCKELAVPYVIERTNIADIVFKTRKEKNPCSLCSRMRRGILNDTLRQHGIRKAALGHHRDDAVETFFMSLLYEGQINCFQPVTYMDRSEITQIRPLLYATEAEILRIVKKAGLPVVQSECPANGESKRAEMKALIGSLKARQPDLEVKVFGAIQRLPLKGYGYTVRRKTKGQRK